MLVYNKRSAVTYPKPQYLQAGVLHEGLCQSSGSVIAKIVLLRKKCQITTFLI